MIRSALLFVATALFAHGQQVPVFLLPQELTQYLQLTAEQERAIGRANVDLAQFASDKSRRAAQVQSEITQEMQKENLDPMGIGLRYVELEAIRREIAAEQKKTRAELENSLTPAQKTKLQTLQDALKMNSVACDAVSLNLMELPAQTSQPPVVSTGRIIIPVMSSSRPACLGGISYANLLLGGLISAPPQMP